MSVSPHSASTRRACDNAVGNGWRGATDAAWFTSPHTLSREGSHPMAQKRTSTPSATTQPAASPTAKARGRSGKSATRGAATPKGAGVHKAKSSATKEATLSGLDAAHSVLVSEGAPMNVQSITKTIFGKKLWTTSGKTPHATIAAAIMREIATKAAKSRFVKAGRGLFAASETTTSVTSTASRHGSHTEPVAPPSAAASASPSDARTLKKSQGKTDTPVAAKAMRARTPTRSNTTTEPDNAAQ